MQSIQKFVVYPFRSVKGRPIQLPQRLVDTSAAAISLGQKMADRYDGVAVFEVTIDPVTDDVTEMRELARHGKAPALEAA